MHTPSPYSMNILVCLRLCWRLMCGYTVLMCCAWGAVWMLLILREINWDFGCKRVKLGPKWLKFGYKFDYFPNSKTRSNLGKILFVGGECRKPGHLTLVVEWKFDFEADFCRTLITGYIVEWIEGIQINVFNEIGKVTISETRLRWSSPIQARKRASVNSNQNPVLEWVQLINFHISPPQNHQTPIFFAQWWVKIDWERHLTDRSQPAGFYFEWLSFVRVRQEKQELQSEVFLYSNKKVNCFWS